MHLTVKTEIVNTAVFMFWNFKVQFLPSCQLCSGFLYFSRFVIPVPYITFKYVVKIFNTVPASQLQCEECYCLGCDTV